MSAVNPKPAESYIDEEEELYEMFQQTPVKPVGPSRIPVSKIPKRATLGFEDFLHPATEINTTRGSLLEPTARKPNVSSELNLFPPKSTTSSSNSKHQITLSDDIRTEHKDISRIEQQSLHIKEEQLSLKTLEHTTSPQPIVNALSADDLRLLKTRNVSVSFSEEEFQKIHSMDALENSIYVKRSTVGPVLEVEHDCWVEDSREDLIQAAPTISVGTYLHCPVDLNETKQIIDNHIDQNSDPFDAQVQRAFLENIELMEYVDREVESCQMVNTLRPLRVNMTVEVNERQFNVMSLIGKGAFGSVYR